jgi:hypothetical protein
MAKITPSKCTRDDDQGPAEKTQVSKCPEAFSSSWIESSFYQWCAPLLETLQVTPCCCPGWKMVPVTVVEWCGWSIASPRPSLEQERWDLSPPSCPLGFVFSKPSKLLCSRAQKKNAIIIQGK